MLQHNIKKYVHVGLLSFVHDKQQIRSNIDNNMIFNFIKSTLTSFILLKVKQKHVCSHQKPTTVQCKQNTFPALYLKLHPGYES